MVVIRAEHVNGNIRMALIRTEAQADEALASVRAAGYWKDITVEPFVPANRRSR